MTITVLGSGTSVGVPTIGCRCEVCLSEDPRDKRLRPSLLIRYGGRNVVIDTTPDFRAQALRARMDHLDAILFTHAHADHIMGLDDVRPFNYHQSAPVPIYGSLEAIATIRRCFDYIFDPRESQSSVPKIVTRTFEDRAFDLFGVSFTPVRLDHGKGIVHGFRFGRAAYLTDHSGIPEEVLEQLRGLDVLFLDALRHRPHPTHSTVERSLGHVERLAPRMTYFTHICHELMHARDEAALPPHVRLAYDGLEIELEDEV